MSMPSLLSRLKKALPVIVANAPAVIDAARRIREALKRRKLAEPPADGPA